MDIRQCSIDHPCHRALWSPRQRLLEHLVDVFLDVEKDVVKNAMEALDNAKQFYREGISKFDDNLINRIVRDPRIAGGMDPEKIVASVFRPNSATHIRRLFRVLPWRS